MPRRDVKSASLPHERTPASTTRPVRKRPRQDEQRRPKPSPEVASVVRSFSHCYGTRSAAGARLKNTGDVPPIAGDVASSAPVERPQFESSKTGTNNGQLDLAASLTHPNSTVEPQAGSGGGRPLAVQHRPSSTCLARGGAQLKTLIPATANQNSTCTRVEESASPSITLKHVDRPSDSAAGATSANTDDNSSAGTTTAIATNRALAGRLSTILPMGTVSPCGGFGSGERRRVRSRLGLGCHRLRRPNLDVGSNNGGVADPSGSAAPGYPWSTSCQQLGGTVVGLASASRPTASVTGKAQSALTSASLLPGGVHAQNENISHCAALDGAALSAATPPRTPPPPFIGLKNLGNTCYINALVQALLACPGVVATLRAATSSRGSIPLVGSTMCEERCSGASTDRGVGRRTEKSDAATNSCDWSPGCLGTSSGKGERGRFALETRAASEDGNERNSVLDELAALLVQMEDHNCELALTGGSRGGEGCDRQPTGNLPAGVGLATKNHVGGRAIGSKASGCADHGCRGTAAAPSRGGSPHIFRSPRNGGPQPSNGMELYGEALVPTSVVELIRTRRLGAGSVNGRELFRRDTTSAGFGSGQQCVSELLGKLLLADAGCSGVDIETARGGPGFVVEKSYGTLGLEFRGAMCVRMLCMECERDRVKLEPFTELTLPPLLRQPLLSPTPPSPPKLLSGKGVAEPGTIGDARSPLELRTIQGLINAAMGSESLGGANKVWCEACRQWTEAEISVSLHALPRLLALHVRPASTMEGQLASQPPPIAESARDGTGFGSFARGPLKAGRTGVGGGHALIERRLTMNVSMRCQFHGSMVEGKMGTMSPAVASARESWKHEDEGSNTLATSEPTQQCDDVHYDLVGVILHQGNRLGSGHYTFALNARVASQHSAVSPAPEVPSGSEEQPVCLVEQEQQVLGSSGGRGSDRQRSPWNSGEARFGRERAGAPLRNDNGEAKFVLFDDDCVRWLSSDESDNVLRGGGGSGNLGDAFLVFYSRRD